MNESKHFKSLPALAEASNHQEAIKKRSVIASVRVSPGQYFAVASVITFLSVLLLRSHRDALALALIVIAWLFIPLLAFTDKIVFDGHVIWRRSLPAFLLQKIFRYKQRLAVEDFETVETSAVRTLRRGGQVRYRYRTEISGKGQIFVISSGGKNYRKLIRELFPLIHEDKL